MSEPTTTITPDLDDPGWDDVQHDTRTIDCASGDHPGCLLPEHCQCPCHEPTGNQR